MNVLVVDRTSDFSNMLKEFLLESSLDNNVCYSNNLIDFALSENKDTFDLVFVSLDCVSNQDISYFSKFSKLIGLSPNSKTTRKFFNDPSFQRIFQRPLDLIAIIKYLDNYCELNLSHKNLNMCVLDVLSKVGFSINHNGTIYLAECIVESKRNYFIRLVDLANIIAKKNNTTAQNVIWAIRNSIKRTMIILGEAKAEKSFKLYDGRRPTPKYLIEFYANII